MDIEHWRIVNQRTGRPATIVSFPSEEAAEAQIRRWWARHAKGGRPDITAEMLGDMRPVRADAIGL